MAVRMAVQMGAKWADYLAVDLVAPMADKWDVMMVVLMVDLTVCYLAGKMVVLLVGMKVVN